MVRELAADGTTVLLTTQHLDEADQLADRIAVVDHGRVIAEGTSAELKAKVGGERIQLVVQPGTDLAAAEVLGRYADGPLHADPGEGRLDAPVPRAARQLAAIVRDLDEAGVTVEDLSVRQPSLDDVFLTLTGEAPPEAATPVLA
jgi:ABC-2 type transport system ATP-binding protein